MSTLCLLFIAMNSLFSGLPEKFEVARYHSLHGLKEHMPSCLEITASSDDGVVMGIQHKTLPYAAVQFHPESILTNKLHGLQIIENALSHLRYKEDDTSDEPKSGAEIIGELEKLGQEELATRLDTLGLSTIGSKSELVVRLTLWTHKSNEVKSGRLALTTMSMEELKELQKGLGLRKPDVESADKAELLEALQQSLYAVV